LLAFAADAGAFAALRGQNLRMAGVGVAPGEIVLQAAGQHGVIGVVRAAHDGLPRVFRTGELVLFHAAAC